MIKTYIAGLSVLAAFTCHGAVRLDPMTRLRLDADHPALSRADEGDSTQHPPYQPMILQIDGDDTVALLRDLGVIIYNQRADLLLTSIPYEQLAVVLALDGVINCAASGDMSSMMDVARPFCLVDAAQQGELSLPQGYDGSGVVVGFADIGFDAQHVAFDGRVAQVWNFDTEQGTVRSALTPAEIAAWRIDTEEEYHATHVAGILAGGYKGNPYYGVATGAEIVATTSSLHDVGILAGVERVIAYAKEKAVPAVVNISMSNHLGAHDGTSLICQYLSRCAEDATICISAGNSGEFKIFAQQDLSECEGRVRINTFQGWDGFNVAGYAEVWSQTDEAFEFCLEVYDSDTRQIVYSTPWVTGEFSGKLTPDNDPDWGKYFTGALYVAGGTALTNGHYMVAIGADTHTETVAKGGPWSRYTTCLATRRCPGSDTAPTVNYFADGIYIYFSQVYDWPTKVTTTGSINDMVTADGIISVGMAISRVEVPKLGGGEFTWAGTPGTISPYSAYSDAESLPQLPLISAPGWYVVSALSDAYVSSHPDCQLTCADTVDGTTYYWGPTCGTSMSSPFMAGVAALWLQADPSLTCHDIIDIATSTAQRQYSDISDPRWGAGAVDAVAGLQEVLHRAGMDAPTVVWHVGVGPDRRIVAEGIDAASLVVYDISGMRIDAASTLAPGVYVAVAPDGRAKKLLVR